MNKKINLKNVSLTILVASNLLLMNQAHTFKQENSQLKDDVSHWIDETLALEWDVFDLRNELVTLDEETADYYFLYKETLNDLYMLQVETGIYNENETNATRNPMTGKIENMLLHNHEQGNY